MVFKYIINRVQRSLYKCHSGCKFRIKTIAQTFEQITYILNIYTSIVEFCLDYLRIIEMEIIVVGNFNRNYSRYARFARSLY